MFEYEISDDKRIIGNVKIYNKINNNYSTIIESMDNSILKLVKENYQSYIINIKVDDEDELYDNVSIYLKNNILDEIENLKKINNIKKIKKDTKLDIIIPGQYLKLFNKNIKDVDLFSLFYSKINFLKETLNKLNNKDLKMKLNNIIISFNNFKNSNEFDFLIDEEKEIKVKKYINEIDKIINSIESSSSYKFGYDFITPIRVN